MTNWTIDKHVNISIIGAMFLQTLAIVWWASNITATVDKHDLQITSLTLVTSTIVTDMATVKERVGGLKETGARIEEKLDAIAIAAPTRK